MAAWLLEIECKLLHHIVMVEAELERSSAAQCSEVQLYTASLHTETTQYSL